MIKFKIALDCIVFAYENLSNELKVLLINRNNEPAKGEWALPGGFVKQTEEFVTTAKRKLIEETGATRLYLEQLQAYSLTDPSPDNRIASVAFYSLIKMEDFSPLQANNHIYKWVNIKKVTKLPFDHTTKINDAIQRIKEKIHTKPIIFDLLPKKFTINQLQKIYEEIYDIQLDNRNFRRKAKSLPYLEPLNEVEENVSRRPGELYKFNKHNYEKSIQITGLIA